VVLRVERREPESVAWEHELTAFLSHDVPEVVTPLVALDGSTFVETNGTVVSVLPFVEGTALDRDDEAQRLAVARMLARLHWVGSVWKRPRPDRPAFADLDLEVNAWWDVGVVEMPPVLEQAYERTCTWLAAAPWLTRGAVHGDVYRGNLRVRDRRIHGLVDWEDARVDWPAWELANATWEVCKDETRDRLDPDRSARFVDAYVAADGLGEPGPFDELLRLRLVADALYSLANAARAEPWDPRYVDHLLRALEQLDD
jgi:Ser/Thr protein kinase RdoA (MazF antagonist)